MQRSIQLVRGSDGHAVTALLSEITQRHIDDYQNSWLEMLRRYEQEDKFWSWEFKRRIFLSQDNYEGYAIELAGRTEG
ncbi:MAG: GNAT family N-acetyltransferase, partial [Leptolyngbyaceae cyanobacterium CRU_2_3]|nr:GNAT family N-acetyltransferase [Leptolyngbyaceae cyanobacterium CRU_2_3]